MGKNDKIKLFVYLTFIFVIFFGILIVGIIYRDPIFIVLSNKSPGADVNHVLNPTPGFSENNGVQPSEPSVLNQTVPTPEPGTLPPEQDTEYIEAPKSDFMQHMFDSAFEIPGSGNKIEPPPEGRAIELQCGVVPLSDLIPEPYGYFKNIIFLGDSVTTGFDLFKTKVKFNEEYVLRDVTVIAVGSYGIFNALRDISAQSIHPLINGKQAMPEDIIAEKDAKNVLICLGLNDLTWSKTESFVDGYSRLINRIKEKSPDKNIVIMSITPVILNHGKGSLTNDLIMAANNALIEFAKENNIMFIDYGAAVRDEQNCLCDEFSSDNYCHLTITAYNRIVEYLLYHPIKN